MSCGSIGIPL